MAEVRVRNVPADIVGEWKDRAKRHGRSLEAELRELMINEALRPRRELMEDIERFSDSLQEKYGMLPDSTPIIREDRDRLK